MRHFHLLLEVQQSDSTRTAIAVTGYARQFNRTHRHRRHLFQGRYKAIVRDRESYLFVGVDAGAANALVKFLVSADGAPIGGTLF